MIDRKVRITVELLSPPGSPPAPAQKDTLEFTHHGTPEQILSQVVARTGLAFAAFLDILPAELPAEMKRMPLELQYPDVPDPCTKDQAEGLCNAEGYSQIVFNRWFKAGKFTKAHKQLKPDRKTPDKNAPWLFDKAEVIGVCRAAKAAHE